MGDMEMTTGKFGVQQVGGRGGGISVDMLTVGISTEAGGWQDKQSAPWSEKIGKVVHRGKIF